MMIDVNSRSLGKKPTGASYHPTQPLKMRIIIAGWWFQPFEKNITGW